MSFSSTPLAFSESTIACWALAAASGGAAAANGAHLRLDAELEENEVGRADGAAGAADADPRRAARRADDYRVAVTSGGDEEGGEAEDSA